LTRPNVGHVLLGPLLAAACAAAPPLPTDAAGTAAPALPPAVLDDPDWILLVHAEQFLAAPPLRAVLGGLDLADDLDAFLRRGNLDPARLGWLRIEADAGGVVLVLPADQARGLAAALAASPAPGAESPSAPAPDDPRRGPRGLSVETHGNLGVVRFDTPPGRDPAAATAPRDADPAEAELSRLRRRDPAAALVFLWRRPLGVRPELDPTGLLGETAAVGCGLAPESSESLRLGCVLFGPAGEDVSTAALQRLVATVFDSTIGMILDLERAADAVLVDPEPGAAYAEAVLAVEPLLGGLLVLTAVPLGHLLEGFGPPP